MTHSPCCWSVLNSFHAKKGHLWWGVSLDWDLRRPQGHLGIPLPWRVTLILMQFRIWLGCGSYDVGERWWLLNDEKLNNCGDGLGTPAYTVKAHARSLQPSRSGPQHWRRTRVLTPNAITEALLSYRGIWRAKRETTNSVCLQTMCGIKNHGLCMDFFAL